MDIKDILFSVKIIEGLKFIDKQCPYVDDG